MLRSLTEAYEGDMDEPIAGVGRALIELIAPRTC
jgi:hypothetical protein